MPAEWRGTPSRPPPLLSQGTSRIFKSYDFSGLANEAALGRVMSFSSYPAYLSSLDDFYNVYSTGLSSE